MIGVRNKIVLWDVFIWDGELLTGKTFLERRGILKDIILDRMRENGGTLSLPTWYLQNFQRAFDEVTQDPEIDGLVMKNLNGKLNLGRTAAVDSAWMWKCRRESGRYRF